MPHIDDWEGYLPKFKGNDEDNLVENLLEFHKLMHQLDISHEDILMKMFMYSLERHAKKWYRSLVVVVIYSLKEFHVEFHKYCRGLYSSKLLFENCCEELESSLQHRKDCACEEEI